MSDINGGFKFKFTDILFRWRGVSHTRPGILCLCLFNPFGIHWASLEINVKICLSGGDNVWCSRPRALRLRSLIQISLN